MSRAPAILSHKISTLVYAFNRKDELLMLWRRHPPNAGLWSPIGGKLREAEGESPYQCAARETREEIGLRVKPGDFHLTAMVSEHAYEGAAHWLMFAFELKVRMKTLPARNREGIFEFVPIPKVVRRAIPATDRQILWPLFQKYRGSYFAVSIDCRASGRLAWAVEERIVDL